MNLETKAILRRVIAGESVTLDRDRFTLHELTQVAVTLRPEAQLAIRHADTMSPIEQASIACVGRGRVVFLQGDPATPSGS